MKTIKDKLDQARGELEQAEKALADAEIEAKQYAAAGDFEMAQNARRAARTAEGKATDLRERVAALEADLAAAEQRRADDRLRKAIKVAEEAAEGQRTAAADAGDVLERMRELERRLDAAIGETHRKITAAYAAADAAGRHRPAVSTTLGDGKRDAGAMIEQARRLGRVMDRAERSAMALSSQRRKAG